MGEPQCGMASIADTKKQIRTYADRLKERQTSPAAYPSIMKEDVMKLITITLATVLALSSSSFAIAQGVGANGAVREGSSSLRAFTPNRMTPGTTTTGMGRGATGGAYRDNDPNVYRDGQPRSDVNPHGG
jgi:hypothetical protein